MKKLIVLLVSVILLTVIMVACGSSQAACAAPSPPAPRSPSPAPRSPSPQTPKSPSGGGASKSPSAPKTPSGKPAAGAVGASKTPQQSTASKTSKPGAKPDAASISQAKTEAPKNVTRGGSYTSPVTNNTYVYHSQGYYLTPGYPWSIYNPYNPYNYWYIIPGMPVSPFYGTPYMYARGCGEPTKEVKAENISNINITVDNDGKVVKGEDKNPRDSELNERVEADEAPAVADDAPPPKEGE